MIKTLRAALALPLLVVPALSHLATVKRHGSGAERMVALVPVDSKHQREGTMRFVVLAAIALSFLIGEADAQSVKGNLSGTVAPPAQPGSATVTVNGAASGAVLAPSSQFSVGWSGAPGDAPEWIGICQQSSVPYPPNCDATQHYYVSLACYPWMPAEGGRSSGGCSAMEAPSTPGNYQITLYDSGGPNGGNPSSTVNGGYGNILGTATFSVSQPTPPSGSNYGGYLVGGDLTAAGYTNFVNSLAIKPMVEGCGNANCAPTPMHYALPFILSQSQAATAASDPHYADSYIAHYQSQFPYTYFIRICNEWQGNGDCGPFINGSERTGEAIDPATWIAGVRNYITALRANPYAKNVKIAMDVPYTAEEVKYYPGDAYIDILTYDIYNGNGTGGPGGVASWKYVYNTFLAPMLAYGKPMAFPEFCNKFPGGYFIAQMAQFMNTHNVVAIALWNVPGWGGRPKYGEYPCQFDATTDTLAAYQTALKGYQYTGSFWPVVPVPRPLLQPKKPPAPSSEIHERPRRP